MAVNVRHATAEDVGALVAMGKAMHEESPEHHRKDFSEEKTRRLAQSICGVLPAPAVPTCALVAEERGKIIGMMSGFVVEHFFGHDRVASDYVFYVRPEHRGGSAAVRLLRAFEAWALQFDPFEIMPGVTTGFQTEKTVGFYRKLGYEVNGATLVRRVK